jgi:hypothetical protein
VFADDTPAARILEQNREFFSGLARAVPPSGLDVEPCLLDTGATTAFFAGDGNPLTQANGKFAPDDIAAVFEFYRGRTLSWEELVTPFADGAALGRFYSIGAASAGWESGSFRVLLVW